MPKLLDSAGCEEMEITQGNNSIEPIEAIRHSAGLRSAEQEEWKAAFEKSLFENYSVKPHHYEELENGVQYFRVSAKNYIDSYIKM